MIEENKQLINPITFSIPEEKIVNFVPYKTKLLSSLIPGNVSTYIYSTEKDYNTEYKKSMFALTHKKGGWDCLRHYEILANGCIPYFTDIDCCPPSTLALLPKQLIMEGNELYNKLSKKSINEITYEEYDIYNSLLTKLLNYTKNYLTTKKIAEYILDKTNNKNIKKILYLSGNTFPDYLRCLTLHGLKQLLGSNCHDFPKIPHIYKSDSINYQELYGRGYNYTNLLDESLHDDSLDLDIEEQIKNKKFDIIIYGSYHRGMPFYELVCETYKPHEIILLCGEDMPHCNTSISLCEDFGKCDYSEWDKKGHYVFVREL